MPDKLTLLRDFLTELVLEADPDKINTIQQFPKPEKSRQLQRFTGMINYLRQYCLELATAAAPISELQASTK